MRPGQFIESTYGVRIENAIKTAGAGGNWSYRRHLENFGCFLYWDESVGVGKPIVAHLHGRMFWSKEDRAKRGWPAVPTFSKYSRLERLQQPCGVVSSGAPGEAASGGPSSGVEGAGPPQIGSREDFLKLYRGDGGTGEEQPNRPVVLNGLSRKERMRRIQEFLKRQSDDVVCEGAGAGSNSEKYDPALLARMSRRERKKVPKFLNANVEEILRSDGGDQERLASPDEEESFEEDRPGIFDLFEEEIM